MRILAIESTAKAASCAVICDGAVEALAWQNAGLTHSQTLMPMVEGMLGNARIALSDVDVVAAAHGPGSFTGVRIGVATALGIAAGCGARAVGVSTLAAMGELVAHVDAVAVCSMDARRSEVYAAAFHMGERLCDDVACPASEFAARAAEFAKIRGKSLICIGDGAELCYNSLTTVINDLKAVSLPLARNRETCYNNLLEEGAQLAPAHLLRQSAAGVGMLADRLLRSGEDLPPLRPVYLRVSQAERERNARLGK